MLSHFDEHETDSTASCDISYQSALTHFYLLIDVPFNNNNTYVLNVSITNVL